MGTTETNPAYPFAVDFGHTSRTLRQVASALDRELRVGFVPRSRAHDATRPTP